MPGPKHLGLHLLPIIYPPYKVPLTGNHDGLTCISKKGFTWLFVSIFNFFSSQFLKQISPQTNFIVVLEESSTATVCKSQLVIARVHVIKRAKNALELSYEPVILITWRDIMLGQ